MNRNTVAHRTAALALATLSAAASVLVSGSAFAMTADELPPELQPDPDEPITEEPMTDDAWVGGNSVAGRPLGKVAAGGLSFSKGDTFGNDQWGGGFSLSGGATLRQVGALPGKNYYNLPCTVPAHVEDSFGLNVGTWARLFGRRVDAIGLNAQFAPPVDYDSSICIDAHHSNRAIQGELDVSLLGVILFTRDLPIATTNNNPFIIYQGDGHLFSAETQFTIGPVPVTVGAAASYSASLTWNAAAQPGSSAAVGVTPSADIGVSVSAGVGVPGFNVGVMGSLSILRLSSPVSVSHTKSSQACRTTLQTNLDASLKVSSLNGTISLFARGPKLVWKDFYPVTRLHTYKRDIASWSGELDKTVPLLGVSGYSSTFETCGGSDTEYEY